MERQTKAGLAVVGGAALLAGLLMANPYRQPAMGGVDTDAGVTAAQTRAAAYATIFQRQAAADIPVFITGLENLPASLQGTEVDGAFELDADGHLRINNAVRRVFDYFLTAVGEEPLDTVLARLRAYIRTQLPSAAAAEAEEMLAGYLAYKEALAGMQDATQPAGGRVDPAAVRSALAQARALRQAHMSTTAADAFYADEDAMNDYMLDRLVILQDAQLSASERAGRLAARETQLPASLREATKTVNQYQNLQVLTVDWQGRAGSPAELREIRENLLGAEAADRLETLDRERAEWDGRMAAWRRARGALLAASGLDEADRRQQIDVLRSEHFRAEELARVQARERIDDAGNVLAVQR